MNTKNQIKMIPLVVAYYGPNTTSRIRRTTLGRPCASFQAIHRRRINSPSYNSRNNSVKQNLQTIHRQYDIWHLLVSKPPCNSYISKNVSKTSITVSYQFSRKMCHSTKLGFKITFMKF